MSKNFAIIGVAGYIAPRHLEAIKHTGNRLVAAVDPHDSVGIMDRYFHDAQYFSEFERFDRHVERLRRESPGQRVDYVSICSPNHLHDAHCRFALRVGADAICEKPLVLNPWNCDALQELEVEYQRRIYTVLQLRVHPSVIALRQKYRHRQPGAKYQVNLSYITSRGAWYLYSWKGNQRKSGGLAHNIGIHFFDMLLWIFGGVVTSEVRESTPTTVSGDLELERANVTWDLSIDRARLPAACRENGQSTFRSITVDSQEVEFSGGFTDLHTRVYEDVLSGRGHGIEDIKPAIELVHRIRSGAS